MEERTMKKQLILAAVAAVGALVCSCQNEQDIAVPSAGSGEVRLVIGDIATRSAVPTAATYSYDLETKVEGVKLSLEESVVEMGALTDVAETRGTPVYTSNVQDVHGDAFNGVVYGASGQVVGDGAFEVFRLSSKNCWRREIGFDPWEKAGGDVTFFLRMPSSQPEVSNLAYDYGAGSVSFDYETPSVAVDQQDILFATRNLDKSTYESEYKDGGASVLFRHALTGVKFAIGNNTTEAGNRQPAGEVQTYITKVEITGLLDKGHAVYVPSGTETTTDDASEHSSAGSFTWTDGTTSPTRTSTYVQEYTEDDIQDYASGDYVNAGSSFYTGGANRNLNDATASMTFWFRPQAITSDLVVTVTMKVWNGKSMSGEKTLVLNMGELIAAQGSTANKEWKAGQLRTFTLKPGMVDVEIEDEVHGFVKEKVVIRNTGNVDAYIRAHIVANWWGKTVSGDDGIALGYTSSEATSFVAAWEMSGTTGDNYGGAFTGLPGSDWVKAKDGFFYYKNKVAPGAETGSKLFTKYELVTTEHPVPEIWYLSSGSGLKQFTEVRLVMDIPVQAIEAKEGYADYKAAWAAAGVTVETE